jgi:exodeoxyribonuclease VII small subunit
MTSFQLGDITLRMADPTELGFDAVLARLREVVQQLESGELSLEDSLRVYEEGVQMARRGHHLLDRAEKRVELLVSGAGPGGSVDTATVDDTEAP